MLEKRRNAINSGHIVMWQRTQAARTNRLLCSCTQKLRNFRFLANNEARDLETLSDFDQLNFLVKTTFVTSVANSVELQQTFLSFARSDESLGVSYCRSAFEPA